jgi:hypothetical protein
VAATKEQPMATVTSPGTEGQLESELREKRDRFWRAVEEIGASNRDGDFDEELAFITQVVEEVRQEHYERAQREAKDGR